MYKRIECQLHANSTVAGQRTESSQSTQ